MMKNGIHVIQAVLLCGAFVAVLGQGANVNFVTGQLEFSEVLLSTNGHRVSFPVNISYSSRITRHQRASWAGLGFTLDMPYIERKVRGYPDDHSGHSRYLWGQAPQTLHPILAPDNTAPGAIDPLLFFDFFVYNRIFGGGYHYSSRDGVNCPPAISQNPPNDECIDFSQFNPSCTRLENATQQDAYSLNLFPGGGGNLFFAAANEILDETEAEISPYRPWKITPHIGTQLSKWQIIDENGTKYVFGSDGGFGAAVVSQPIPAADYETAKITYLIGSDGSRQHNSTVIEANTNLEGGYIKRWYLASIESYDGDRIEFTYTTAGNAELTEPPYISNINKYEYEINPGEPNGPKGLIVQAIVTDPSESVSPVVPLTISSALQTVTFETETQPAGTIRNELGRDRLKSITLRDKISNTVLEKVSFDYYAAGFFGTRNLTKLRGITKRRAALPGGTKRLYSFEYADDPDPTDDFGTMVAQITRMEDVNGRLTEYSYGPGSFDATTNTAHFACQQSNVGRVVTTIRVKGGSGTSAVVHNLSYEHGEVPYNPIFRCGGVFFQGLDATLEQFEYEQNWRSKFQVYLEDYAVYYRQVVHTISGGQTGRTEYEFYTANTGYQVWNNGVQGTDYSLSDGDDEYHVNADYRYRIREIREYATGKTEPLKTTTSFYTAYLRGGTYSKPQTFGMHYMFTPYTSSPEQQYCVQMVEGEGFENFGQFGLPGAEMYRSVVVQLRNQVVLQSGVKKTDETYSYNDKELFSRKEEKGLSSGDRITKYTYTYEEQPGIAYFTEKNLLSPVARISIESGPTIFRMSRVLWGQFNQGAYYPSQSFAWDGTQFILSEETKYRNQYGYVLDTRTVAGTLPVSVIYRTDKFLTSGQVTNSDYRECGAYTCDYAVNDPAHADYLDYLNGWKKNGATLVTLATPHFTDKCISIANNSIGPSRSIKILSQKDYVMTAWVKPISGTVKIWGEYRRLQEGNGVTTPFVLQATKVKDFGNPAQVVTGAGDWRLVELKIPASTDISGAEWTQYPDNWYAYLYISTHAEGETDGVAYVSDIRIHPAKALSTSTFYDDRSRVTCVVDANGKAKYSEYDAWDRVSKIKNNAKNTVIQKEYKLAGDIPE